MENTQPKYNFDAAAGSTHTLVINQVPAGSKVLEIGSAGGYIGNYLHDEKGCEVWGVEPEAFASENYAGYKELANKTAEQFLQDGDFKGESFAVIMLADVLEHLVDPAAVLRELSKKLAPNGKVIISLPNIAHWSIRRELLWGRWNMTDKGILDRTHLHFYSLRGAKEMIRSAGLAIELELPANGAWERFGMNKLLGIGRKLLYAFPELLSQQYVFVAKNMNVS